MKKIVLLSFALLACLVTLHGVNKVDAQGYTGGTGELSLEINAGTLSCTYPSDIYIGSGFASFSAQDITGAFSGDFVCEDLKGDATWSLQIMSDDLVNQSDPGYTIPASAISFKSSAATGTNGTCSVNPGTTVYTSIDTARSILGKTSDPLAVCEITATNAQIKVTVPADQAVGQYVSTLTYTIGS